MMVQMQLISKLQYQFITTSLKKKATTHRTNLRGYEPVEFFEPVHLRQRQRQSGRESGRDRVKERVGEGERERERERETVGECAKEKQRERV